MFFCFGDLTAKDIYKLKQDADRTLQSQRFNFGPAMWCANSDLRLRKEIPVPLEHLPPKRKFPWEEQRSPHPALL